MRLLDDNRMWLTLGPEPLQRACPPDLRIYLHLCSIGPSQRESSERLLDFMAVGGLLHQHQKHIREEWIPTLIHSFTHCSGTNRGSTIQSLLKIGGGRCKAYQAPSVPISWVYQQPFTRSKCPRFTRSKWVVSQCLPRMRCRGISPCCPSVSSYVGGPRK